MNKTEYSYDAMHLSRGQIWSVMARELWGARELVWRLIYRDIAVRYRQSFLGYVWAVLPQLVTVAIFGFLAKHRVFDMGETSMPYVVHALWSISVWILFSSCLVNATNSLVNAGSLVTKINFPKATLVVASIGQSILDFVIRLLPICVVMFWYGFIPSIQTLWMPLIIIAIVFMALGVGFILAIVNLVLRDMGNVVSMIMTFGMFLAPVLYPPPVREPFNLVNILNPFSPLLIATQNLLSGQDFLYPRTFWLMILLSLVIFFIGWRIFHITMPRIAERA